MFRCVGHIFSKKSKKSDQQTSEASSSNAASTDTPPVTATAAAAVPSDNSEAGSDKETKQETAPPPEKPVESDETPFGLKILVDRPPETANGVDIIAIHGLNGHRDKTWTDNSTRLNWLADPSCLCKDIPNARVLSFGYNSASYFSRSDANIQDFASELLAAIKSSRRSNTEKQRPIIFICHSLGGLVFKQAVIRAHEQNKYYAQFLDSIKGVVFFATPHRGSDLAFWDLLGTRVVKATTLGYTTNTMLSKELKLNSATLKSISESFTYRGWGFEIRSFYETQLMPGLNCRVVEKDSAILGWGNELDVASSAHHSNICKFPSPKDQRYQNAIDAISDLIHPQDTAAAQPLLSAQDLHQINRLNSNYKYHLEQVDDAVPGTCEWVLKHDKWKQWESNPESSLLWITSNAGCGKSVQAKSLVNHFLSKKNTHSNTKFAYFFFVDGITGQDNAAAAASALLHQLYNSRHDLSKLARKRLERVSDSDLNRFSILWSIIIEIIKENALTDVVWLFDGVDECETQSLKLFIKAISKLFDNNHLSPEQYLGDGKLKIILLSRPSSIIQNTLSLFADTEKDHSRNKVRLTGENEIQALTADITLFARWKISELSSTSALPDDILEKLNKTLVAGADFTFLWISLIIKMVEDSALNGMSIADLETILAANSLDSVYEQLLARPARASPDETRKILSIILAAVRPLTLDELCVAVEISTGHATSTLEEQVIAEHSETLDMPNHWTTGKRRTRRLNFKTLGERLRRPFDNRIRQLCGHFVRIRCRKVYLVHQTARAFLSSKSFKLESSSEQDELQMWRPIRSDSATQTILNICLNYLQMFVREPDDSGSLQTWNERRIDKYLESCKSDLPKALFPYAALFWIRHYKAIRQRLKRDYDWMLQPDTVHFDVWAKVHLSWIEEHDATDESQGARWIDGKKPLVKHQEEDSMTLYSLYYEFRALQEWVYGEWIIMSGSRQLYEDAMSLKQRLLTNPDFEKLEKYFQQTHIQTLLRDTSAVLSFRVQVDLDSLPDSLEAIRQEWQREIAEVKVSNLLRSGKEKASISSDLYAEGIKQSIQVKGSNLLRRGKEKASISSDLHAEGIEKNNEAQAVLHESLMHFNLLELVDVGLEDDEFLKGLGQFTGNYPPSAVSDLDDERADSPELELQDSEMPNRIKHYIRGKAREVIEKSISSNTPGATFPELSNPGTLGLHHMSGAFSQHRMQNRAIYSRSLDRRRGFDEGDDFDDTNMPF